MPPSVYCEACLGRHSAHEVVRADGPSAKTLCGISLSVLDERVSRAISVFKEKNQFAAARAMVDALLPIEPTVPIDIVAAVPSAQSSFAKRGFVPAELIAKQVARLWKLANHPGGLRFIRSVRDQSALRIIERQTNLFESMAASRSFSGKRVLLVDDIITTGSTLFEATRAIEVAGGSVVAFVTLAETPRRIEPSPHPAHSQVGP